MSESNGAAKRAPRVRRRAAEILSTGDVARLVGASPRLVTKWTDAGTLAYYRLPMSRDRRIHRVDLVRFLQAEGRSLPPALRGGVLVAGPPELSAGLGDVGVEVVHCTQAYSLGRMVESGRGWVCAVLEASGWVGVEAVRTAADDLRWSGVPTVGVLPEDGSGLPAEMFTAAARRPDVAAAVRRLVGG